MHFGKGSRGVADALAGQQPGGWNKGRLWQHAGSHI